MLTDSFRTMLILSTGLGAVCGFVGIYLSYFVDVSSGASIVLVEAIVFAFALGYNNLRTHRADFKQRMSTTAQVSQPSSGELD
jgi:ABC-type Mn2+/Zn2+ transport system permease subunit